MAKAKRTGGWLDRLVNLKGEHLHVSIDSIGVLWFPCRYGNSFLLWFYQNLFRKKNVLEIVFIANPYLHWCITVGVECLWHCYVFRRTWGKAVSSSNDNHIKICNENYSFNCNYQIPNISFIRTSGTLHNHFIFHLSSRKWQWIGGNEWYTQTTFLL